MEFFAVARIDRDILLIQVVIMTFNALRKLDVLNGAVTLRDLRSPPGNRLEALKGDLQDFYSIRVNNQWRIIFQWSGSDAKNVSLTDYH